MGGYRGVLPCRRIKLGHMWKNTGGRTQLEGHRWKDTGGRTQEEGQRWKDTCGRNQPRRHRWENRIGEIVEGNNMNTGVMIWAIEKK